MATVIGYVRVSSPTQVEEGLGLQVQAEGIEKWAREAGHRVMTIFRDEGVSGTVVGEDRPGLGQALAMLEDSAADALVVYRLDRLARDLILQETLIERLTIQGKEVISVSEPDIGGNDPTRVLVRQLLGAISQYERMVITARMKSGRMAKHARGGYAFGAPRFGWKASGKELVVDSAEQETVARALELRRSGKSLREVGETLMAEGRRPKRGDRWHPKTVARIVQRAEGTSGTAKILPFPSPPEAESA